MMSCLTVLKGNLIQDLADWLLSAIGVRLGTVFGVDAIKRLVAGLIVSIMRGESPGG
jgi:hypothetical protein